MSKLLSLITFTLILLPTGSPYGQQPPDKPYPLIEVTGQGSVKGEPDIASFQAGITTSAPTARTSQKENAERSNRVIETLKRSGIEKKDIQSTRYTIHPQYEYAGGKRTFKGYQTSHFLSVTLHDIAKTGEVLDAVISAGGTDIPSIQFSIEDPFPLENQARSKAVHEAKEKARILAEAAGVKVGKLISIQETLERGRPILPMMAIAGVEESARAETPIEMGEMEIIARVQMKYAIEE